MEVLDKELLVSQENALKIYLDSLLFVGKKEKPSRPVVPDKPEMQLFQPDDLFDAMLMESNNTTDRIKAPAWAVGYFSCLPITVGAITLLIPLRQVRTVVPVRHEITPDSHLPQWVRGTMANFSQQLTVVDMQKMAFQNTEPSNSDDTSQLVLLSSGKTGLSCQRVDSVRQLKEQDIMWRAKESKRRWIAGVSLKHKLVVVDTRRIEFAIAMESRLV